MLLGRRAACRPGATTRRRASRASLFWAAVSFKAAQPGHPASKQGSNPQSAPQPSNPDVHLAPACRPLGIAPRRLALERGWRAGNRPGGVGQVAKHQPRHSARSPCMCACVLDQACLPGQRVHAVGALSSCHATTAPCYGPRRQRQPSIQAHCADSLHLPAPSRSPGTTTRLCAPCFVHTVEAKRTSQSSHLSPEPSLAWRGLSDSTLTSVLRIARCLSPSIQVW